MAITALVFIIETLTQLWIFAVLLRFFAQVMRVPLRARAGNPIADFVMALTDWIVLPLRRVLPSVGRLDLSTLLVAWVASVLLALTILAIVGRANVSAPLFWSALIFYGLAKVIKFSIYLFIGLMIIQAVLSWVSPYHPLRPFFDALTRFLLKPFQRVIPLIGGIDLSPLFVIILLQVLLIAPVAWLEGEALKLLAQS
jgi:YggT family protein